MGEVSPPMTAVMEPGDLRRTMSRFATGVAVVTAESGDTPHGMTVNSLTSVSLQPPLILVSLTVDARTTVAVGESEKFAVSVLAQGQEPIARRFAARAADHFSGLDLVYEHHTVPVVPGGLAHLECAVVSVLPAGDHVIYIGEVQGMCQRAGVPLIFHSGEFVGIEANDSDGSPGSWFF